MMGKTLGSLLQMSVPGEAMVGSTACDSARRNNDAVRDSIGMACFGAALKAVCTYSTTVIETLRSERSWEMA